MAIKKNAQKVLLTLFTPQHERSLVTPVEKLQQVTPDLTESGYRSLLLFLEGKKLIYREKVFGHVSVGITDEGRRTLTALFPSLQNKWQTWQGTWMVLVFLQAPKTDSHFRYLRSLLLAEQAIPLSRGVYLTADSFSQRLLLECQSLYPQSVAIFSVHRWEMGLDRPLIINYYDLAAKAEAYSSTGNQLNQLLGKNQLNKNSTNQLKNHISPLIDRFLIFLREDPGFIKHFFPDTPDASEIIAKLQKVIAL